VTSSIESFSRIVSPVAGGFILGHLHPTWLGYVGGTLSAIAVLLALGRRDNG
jgi:hypothetical protein